MAQLVLFTGGARSGKSWRAEQYASQQAEQVYYLATAQAGDSEMQQRIGLHQAQRPSHWQTIEAPLAASQSLCQLPTGSVVLLDCLTLLVSNLLLANEDQPEPIIQTEIAAMLAAQQARDLNLIIVTNEVGMGIVPAYALGRIYRDLIGRANQQIAAAANEVYLVVAGLPIEIRQLQPAWAK
ncbi:bifunctional adenosylcobinamide kinase/adenosylcobinamide-phosphate guanylyltransferase [Herpetosiphon llansteffanensis]|uniref:bifunctional adenosylcobinamide kinase/adenosylcobinamide-phosphate guanylyltransferase n=1 Tax=Herpetosiphon llansteffanensis TaxID=2094568 RepID=UPI000D7CF9BA|nr:bifunctional adenosylcobinamide kinase/adenosylcobinamide-phosphate guanylyltransferase [Herpetosiphon llansteffanensis]